LASIFGLNTINSTIGYCTQEISLQRSSDDLVNAERTKNENGVECLRMAQNAEFGNTMNAVGTRMLEMHLCDPRTSTNMTQIANVDIDTELQF